MTWPIWLLKELQKKTVCANLGPQAFGIGPNPVSICLTSTTLTAPSSAGAEQQCGYSIGLLNLALACRTGCSLGPPCALLSVFAQSLQMPE